MPAADECLFMAKLRLNHRSSALCVTISEIFPLEPNKTYLAIFPLFMPVCFHSLFKCVLFIYLFITDWKHLWVIQMQCVNKTIHFIPGINLIKSLFH